MGILGLLFALLLPGIAAIRRSADRNLTRQQMSGIEAAMQGFLTEYGRFPLQIRDPSTGRIGPLQLSPAWDSRDTYGLRNELRLFGSNVTNPEGPRQGYIDLIRSLRGLNAEDNPRGTIFLNVSDSYIVEDQYLDPWDHRYGVVADWNMDGNVDVGVGHGTVTNRVVAIWSWARGATTATGSTNAREDPEGHLKSWTTE